MTTPLVDIETCRVYMRCIYRIFLYNTKRVPKKCIHILRDVIYVLLFEIELNYSSNV